MAAPSFDRPALPRVWVLHAAIDAVTVPAAAGRPAPAYAVVGALPDGLRFDPATRVLSGTPTAAGSGAVTVRAANADGAADWVMDYEVDAAAIQQTHPWWDVPGWRGAMVRTFGRNPALPAAVLEDEAARVSIRSSSTVVFGLYLNLVGPGSNNDFKPEVEREAVLRFSCGGVPRLAVRVVGGPVPDHVEPYFITHAPVSGSYKALHDAARLPGQPPVVFSLHHALLAVQGEPVGAALNGAGGGVAAALAMAPPTAVQPVGAALAGAGGAVAAALSMVPAPPVQPVGAALAGAGGSVAAALAMAPVQPVGAALAGAGGSVAAAPVLWFPAAPPAPLAAVRPDAPGRRVVTVAGDVLDALCWRRYGRDAAKDVPAVLAANPGLAAADPVLPAGLVVDLPDLPAPAARPAVRLWGPK